MEYRGLVLDDFQERAVNAIQEGKSVIVSAPTGCGKTVIAEYAVEVSMNLKKKVIYTAPIKALSNQKYRDFRERFGDENVGIQTGDVTINHDAPLLVMTTEIFRNIILEESHRLNDIYYVIYDEVHYIDEPERGTVWEESIILAPKEINFVCLSATIPNLSQLTSWMSQVREREFVVIRETKRPVPLNHYVYNPKLGIIQATKKNIETKLRTGKKKGSYSNYIPDSKGIIKILLKQNQYPILYFCFNRKFCEKNANLNMHLNLLSEEEKKRSVAMIDDLISKYNLKGYKRLSNMRKLWERGCAYHHAGILPAAKEIVERLFNEGLLKLLFCTETFALGINMPARAVVFDELEKFNGVKFDYITTRGYMQMAGRAGRRGMDKCGYVYSMINPDDIDLRELSRIVSGNSEEVNSQFFASYSSILSLYSKMGDQVFDVFKKSFRNYANGTFKYSKSYIKEEQQIRNRIKFLQKNGFLDGTKLTKKGRLAMMVSGYEIQTAELYYSRAFDDCTPEGICILLAALITEQKKRKDGAFGKRPKFYGEKIIKGLRKAEMACGIETPIRDLDFALADPIGIWASEGTLRDLEAYHVPEGDIIRVLRMTIQLIRTLKNQIEDPELIEKLERALELINRDVVDAQAQLEVK